MARNTLAGTKRGKSRTAKFYQNNPASKEKKKAYDTEYHKQPKARKYRAFLNKKKSAGNGKDNAHTGNGNETKPQPMSKNRANNRPKKRSTTAKGMKKFLK